MSERLRDRAREGDVSERGIEREKERERARERESEKQGARESVREREAERVAKERNLSQERFLSDSPLCVLTEN